MPWLQNTVWNTLNMWVVIFPGIALNAKYKLALLSSQKFTDSHPIISV